MEAPGQLQVAKDIARLKAMGESKAAKIADRLILYDNSTNAGHQLIATVEGDRAIIHVRELPRWLDQAILTPLSIE
jgi:predicted ABC-type ATPase